MPNRIPNSITTDCKQYILISPEVPLEDGRMKIALYESVPPNPDFQYTPDLAYCIGQAETAIMHKVPR